MSLLSQLVGELCSDRVEYKTLGELCKIETGKLDANAAVDGGEFAFFTTAKEVSRIDCFRWDTEALLISGNANVGNVKHYIGKFEAYQRTYVLTKFSEIIDVRYLYFILCSRLKQYLETRSNKAAMTYIVLGTLKAFPIPIPSLSVQRKIVRILDNFVELATELTAELAARKKQYEYYRNQLLKFDACSSSQVKWLSLGEVATDMYRGSGIKRDEVTETGTPCVRYGEIYTSYNVWFDTCISHTNLGTKTFGHGDILFAITGESVAEIGKSCVYMGNEKCYAGGDVVVMKHNQNPKYISYVLSTVDAQMQKSKGRVKSKVVHSNIPALKEITIPIPSLKEQERIVEILDCFDALTTDITQGLPAEIAVRQKQYEYYRDKLLAFKERDA
jgi:Restriction endonuclease S subunits